jgi:hypothetical protein
MGPTRASAPPKAVDARRELSPADIDTVLAEIAINRVLLDGKGTYMVGHNKAMWEDRGHFLGHVAVSDGTAMWDAEGRTDHDRVESCGMLDPEDTDWAEAYRNGWDALKAETAPVNRGTKRP